MNGLVALIATVQFVVLLMIFSNTLDSFILMVHSFTKQYSVSFSDIQSSLFDCHAATSLLHLAIDIIYMHLLFSATDETRAAEPVRLVRF